mmetsp:Transcript_34178/g.66562  ORF Transcript_34178/g.66562 Transcript_34178/m.66562 type:complete len:172 (-) Transcript_34178:52-567(-)
MKVSYFVFNWEFHCERLGSMDHQRIFLKRYFISALVTAVKEQQFMMKYKGSLASSSVENKRAMFDSFGDSYSLKSAMEDVNRSIADRQVRPSPAVDVAPEPADDLFGDDFDPAPVGGGYEDEAKHGGGDVDDVPAVSVSAEGIGDAAAAPVEDEARPPPKKKRRKKKKKFV